MHDLVDRHISLSAPCFVGNELIYVEQAIRTGWVSYAGPFVRQLEESLADAFGVGHGIATCSGTTALQLALHVSDVRNCEVLLPALSFIAPASSVIHAGGIPVFIDVQSLDWQLDIGLMKRFLKNSCQVSDGIVTNRTTGRRVKAICAVHLLGGLADIPALRGLADEYRLDLIEDAAEAIGAKYDGEPIGAIKRAPNRGAHLITTSLNANKVVTAGGGGCVLTDDESIAARVRHLAGTAKCGTIEYYHDEPAFNYRMTNILAGVGLAQMECLRTIIDKRRKILEAYLARLGSLPLTFMPINSCVSENCWLTTVLFRTSSRAALKSLLSKGIDARPVWVPMPQLSMFQSCEYLTETGVANSIWNRALSLPSGSGLSIDDVGYVCESLMAFFDSAVQQND